MSEVFPHQPESTNVDENLLARLSNSSRPLRVKLGIDPTGSEIHLGHSTLVRKLRAFQDAGHTAILLIGDFTARIGDPTDRAEVRRQLSEAEVKANAETYIEQIRPILDFETPGRLEIRYNSEWLSDIDLSKMLELLKTMTLGQMLAKEGFANRYESGTPVYLHEFLYPLLQGYDSVALESDIELGGTRAKVQRGSRPRPPAALWAVATVWHAATAAARDRRHPEDVEVVRQLCRSARRSAVDVLQARKSAGRGDW